MTRQIIPMLIAVVAIVNANTVAACPFCPTAGASTIREDLNTLDAVVLARLIKVEKSEDGVPEAQFKIATVLKGKEHLDGQTTVKTILLGEPNKDATYMICGTDPPKLMWSTPLGLTASSLKYVEALAKMPKDAPNRLEFYQKYLENKDEMVARDAFDEFARTSYDDVKAHKSKMDHDQLVTWIKSPDVPASRRRLYFTMLGICGSKKDKAFLESMIRSSDRKQKAGLDAMIACYLTLCGTDGLPLIEDIYIKDKKAEYADTYSAIMALRFHADQGDVIPRKRAIASLRLMLERPPLADLVIPDLAKYKDWSAAPRLVELFKTADEKSSWVRLPVVNYLRACPLPEAQDYLKELEKIDPATVQRAKTIFPKTATKAVD